MIKILFLCHGNICRSPMAEFVMRDMVRRAGMEKEIAVSSAATTTEELGNDVHPGTQRELKRHGIPFEPREAWQMSGDDYERYDYLVAMDRENLRHIARITGGDPKGKVRLLLSFAGEEREVADPWYTRDFGRTYGDIERGCRALLGAITRNSFSGGF